MNIFEYLKADDAHIERRLKQVTAHAFEWPHERVFEESVKVFTAITVHLDKKETLLTRYLSCMDDDLKHAILLATNHRYEIENQIDSLTQMHVDEADFGKSLESLLRRVINHRKFCEDSFYPYIEDHLSKNERELIDSQFEDMVFS